MLFWTVVEQFWRYNSTWDDPVRLPGGLNPRTILNYNCLTFRELLFYFLRWLCSVEGVDVKIQEPTNSLLAYGYAVINNKMFKPSNPCNPGPRPLTPRTPVTPVATACVPRHASVTMTPTGNIPRSNVPPCFSDSGHWHIEPSLLHWGCVVAEWQLTGRSLEPWHAVKLFWLMEAIGLKHIYEEREFFCDTFKKL